MTWFTTEMCHAQLGKLEGYYHAKLLRTTVHIMTLYARNVTVSKYLVLISIYVRAIRVRVLKLSLIHI